MAPKSAFSPGKGAKNAVSPLPRASTQAITRKTGAASFRAASGKTHAKRNKKAGPT
jgi:hypothetical protein